MKILSEDGSTLIYCRITGHNHVNEQSFVSWRRVSIAKNGVVIIRVDMNTSSYWIEGYKEFVESRFIATEQPTDFATKLATKSPLQVDARLECVFICTQVNFNRKQDCKTFQIKFWKVFFNYFFQYI